MPKPSRKPGRRAARPPKSFRSPDPSFRQLFYCAGESPDSFGFRADLCLDGQYVLSMWRLPDQEEALTQFSRHATPELLERTERWVSGLSGPATGVATAAGGALVASEDRNDPTFQSLQFSGLGDLLKWSAKQQSVIRRKSFQEARARADHRKFPESMWPEWMRPAPLAYSDSRLTLKWSYLDDDPDLMAWAGSVLWDGVKVGEVICQGDESDDPDLMVFSRLPHVSDALLDEIDLWTCQQPFLNGDGSPDYIGSVKNRMGGIEHALVEFKQSDEFTEMLRERAREFTSGGGVIVWQPHTNQFKRLYGDISASDHREVARALKDLDVFSEDPDVYLVLNGYPEELLVRLLARHTHEILSIGGEDLLDSVFDDDDEEYGDGDYGYVDEDLLGPFAPGDDPQSVSDALMDEIVKVMQDPEGFGRARSSRSGSDRPDPEGAKSGKARKGSGKSKGRAVAGSEGQEDGVEGDPPDDGRVLH